MNKVSRPHTRVRAKRPTTLVVWLALLALALMACQRADGASSAPSQVELTPGESSAPAASQVADADPLPSAGATTPGGASAPPPSPSAVEPPLDPADAILAYSRCIRENGYPEWPDPTPDGQIIMLRSQGQSFDDPRRLAAMEACQALRPAGFGSPGVGEDELAEVLLEFARCMRANGVPDFPDPTPTAGRFIMGPGTIGVDPSSPRFQAALRACAGSMPGGMMAR
jgi:hypothetical protein